jgi:outer membrane biosynthesis protein TonB
LAILERLRAGDFVTLVKNKLPSAQYFVVSALGHSSYNDRMDSAGISSFRISDPIRWAASTAVTEVPTGGVFMTAEAKAEAENLPLTESAPGELPPVVKPQPIETPLFPDAIPPKAAEEPKKKEKKEKPAKAEVNEEPEAEQRELEPVQEVLEEPEESVVEEEVVSDEVQEVAEESAVSEEPDAAPGETKE